MAPRATVTAMNHEDQADSPQAGPDEGSEPTPTHPEGPAQPAAAALSSRLGEVGSRLDALAVELEAGPDPERADQLVREASELASEAGREVEAALRDSAEPDGS